MSTVMKQPPSSAVAMTPNASGGLWSSLPDPVRSVVFRLLALGLLCLALSLASDAVRSGEPEALEKRLNEYVDSIRDAHQTMIKTGRDAHRKPKGFKDLEIALRRQIRMLDDLGHGVTFDQREPVDKAKQEASDIRDDLLKALFGEQNARSRKG